MKRMILVLAMLLAFAIPAMATGSVTGYIEYNDAATEIYSDYLELKLNTKVSDDLTTGLTITINDINAVDPLDVAASLDLIFAKGHTIGVATEIDIATSSFTYIQGNILKYSLDDDLTFNAKARYNFAGNYYAVANVAMDLGKFDLLVEGRVDSDGTVPYSAEAQLKYAVTKDLDVIVGYEINGWTDAINAWDKMTITSDANTMYAKIIYKF